jgi:hypothetical protein
VRRPLLLTASTLGLLICLIGGTGLFAALSDTAHTGTNSIDTAALPSSADLKLATASFDPNLGFTCGTYSDDLATGLISYSDMPPNFGLGAALCIKNAGSQSVSLSWAIDELTDIDLACTGDEADLGDTTCGNDQLGELSGVLHVNISDNDCAAGSQNAMYDPGMLSSLSGSPQAIGTLGAGATRCFLIGVDYNGFAVPAADQQRAQSDKVTWRFVFTGQA